MWNQTHTCTIQTMVEAVSVAREATNGESSSNSVSTQECAKLHLGASIFPKILHTVLRAMTGVTACKASMTTLLNLQ